MKTENSVLRQQALESLNGNWGIAVGGFFIYLVITGVYQSVPFIGSVASLILTGPFQLGLIKFTLAISRQDEPRIEQLFEGFNDFNRALQAYLRTLLFVILWALLLIVPGIIAALSYSMTFFILADDVNISANEAMQKSKVMMEGHKMDLFLLSLSFIGWAILCVLTLGIGFLWLIPYMQVSIAKFYQDRKGTDEPFSSNSSLLDDYI
ncbi:MAG: DUF975 family protein [Crocinitomicaceae bacterium]